MGDHFYSIRSERALMEHIEIACSVSDLRAVTDLGTKFRTIYADPSWQYSKGKDHVDPS